jgi:hypothetical protein
MLPCIVIDFLITNQRTNYPNLFCYKTLHVSGIFFAHHQEFSTVHSALVSFMQVSDDRIQAESGWNTVPSCLCLDTDDDGQRRYPKHVEFYNRINLDNQCVWLVIKKERRLCALWPILLSHILKMCQLHEDGEGNGAETCRSYVKYCTHKLWKNGVAGVTWGTGVLISP